MNAAAFGGWGWKRTRGPARKVLSPSRGLDFLQKLALVTPLPSSKSSPEVAKSFLRCAASRHTPVAFESVSRQPGIFRSQPPKAAEFITPARQGWEQRVADEKPRRGDIKYTI